MSKRDTPIPLVLVRRNGNDDRWHIADPFDGSPFLGEFQNSYRLFESREEAVEFVFANGYEPTFDDEESPNVQA